MSDGIEEVINMFIENDRVTHILPMAVERKLYFKVSRKKIEEKLNEFANQGKIEKLPKPVCPVCQGHLEAINDEMFECYSCVRDFHKGEIYYITEYKVS